MRESFSQTVTTIFAIIQNNGPSLLAFQKQAKNVTEI